MNFRISLHFFPLMLQWQHELQLAWSPQVCDLVHTNRDILPSLPCLKKNRKNPVHTTLSQLISVYVRTQKCVKKNVIVPPPTPVLHVHADTQKVELLKKYHGKIKWPENAVLCVGKRPKHAGKYLFCKIFAVVWTRPVQNADDPRYFCMIWQCFWKLL